MEFNEVATRLFERKNLEQQNAILKSMAKRPEMLDYKEDKEIITLAIETISIFIIMNIIRKMS